jgi:hypothetical protein
MGGQLLKMAVGGHNEHLIKIANHLVKASCEQDFVKCSNVHGCQDEAGSPKPPGAMLPSIEPCRWNETEFRGSAFPNEVWERECEA